MLDSPRWSAELRYGESERAVAIGSRRVRFAARSEGGGTEHRCDPPFSCSDLGGSEPADGRTEPSTPTKRHRGDYAGQREEGEGESERAVPKNQGYDQPAAVAETTRGSWFGEECFLTVVLK